MVGQSKIHENYISHYFFVRFFNDPIVRNTKLHLSHTIYITTTIIHAAQFTFSSQSVFLLRLIIFAWPARLPGAAILHRRSEYRDLRNESKSIFIKMCVRRCMYSNTYIITPSAREHTISMRLTARVCGRITNMVATLSS